MHNDKMTCQSCNKVFATPFSLRRHRKDVHKEQIEFSQRSQQICPICRNGAGAVLKDLQNHLEVVHKIVIEKEILTFQTEDEFLKWKKMEETKTNSLYVQHWAKKVAKSGQTSIYFYCHRSGYFNSQSTGKRNVKVLGSNKIQSICPAVIKLRTHFDNLLHVEYIKTHVGHTCEVGRMRLTAEEKKMIAQKIANKVPFSAILEELRSGVNSEVGRIHLTGRRDLLNITREFRLKQSLMDNQNDAESIDVWVEKVSGEDSPVVFYKPQNVDDDCGILENVDFVLIVMNLAQKKMLNMYGKNIVCVDSICGINSTRGMDSTLGMHSYCAMNAHNIYLTSILVVDDKNEAFPTVFIYSNRQDEVLAENVLRKLKIAGISIQVNILMTNLDQTYYNAWMKVFGQIQHHVFCTWLVDYSWSQNLKLISSQEAQAEAYKMIRGLLDESDENTFENNFQTVIYEMNTPEMAEFRKYFTQHFSDNTPKWACCYQKCLEIKTITSLERIHRTVNQYYLGRGKFKRLTTSIHVLQKFVVFKQFDRIITLCPEKIPLLQTIITNRHVHSTNLNTEDVISSGNGWLVKSESDDGVFYNIERNISKCSKPCPVLCSECNFCLHDFHCNCIDNSIRGNMCKHIHLLVRRDFSSKDAEGVIDEESLVRENGSENTLVSSEIAGNEINKNVEIRHFEVENENQNCLQVQHLEITANVNQSNQQEVRRHANVIEGKKRKRKMNSNLKILREELNEELDECKSSRDQHLAVTILRETILRLRAGKRIKTTSS